MRSLQDFFSYSEQPPRRKAAGRLAWPVLFTLTEVCAVIVVLTQIRVPAVQAAALAFVLSGLLVALWSEWQGTRFLIGRHDNPPHASAPGGTCQRHPDADPLSAGGLEGGT